MRAHGRAVQRASDMAPATALLVAPRTSARSYAPELVSACLPQGTVLRASRADDLEQALAAVRAALAGGTRLLIAAGSDVLLRVVASATLGVGGARIAYLPAHPGDGLSRWLGLRSVEDALARLGAATTRCIDAARINGRTMLASAQLGAREALSGHSVCAELLLDGQRVDARLGAISIAQRQGLAGRGLEVMLWRARVDPRIRARPFAAQEPLLVTRHGDGSATWKLVVQRFSARLQSPLSLSIDGGAPAPGACGPGSETSVLDAEHVPHCLTLVG